MIKKVMDTALTSFKTQTFKEIESRVKRDITSEEERYLFLKSQTKDDFFKVAKQASRPHQLADRHIANKTPMENFYNACLKQGALAIPLFNKIEGGIFNITGQYISQGLARAIGELLVPEENEDTPLGIDYRSLKLREINLDDNGLKDE